MGCWWKPSLCHGDILVKLFKERHGLSWSEGSDDRQLTPVLNQGRQYGDPGDDSGNNEFVFDNTYDSEDSQVDEFSKPSPLQPGPELYEPISDLSRENHSFIALTPIYEEPIINPTEWDELDALQISTTDSVTSIDTLSLLECRPLIINSTSDASLNGELGDPKNDVLEETGETRDNLDTFVVNEGPVVQMEIPVEKTTDSRAPFLEHSDGTT